MFCTWWLFRVYLILKLFRYFVSSLGDYWSMLRRHHARQPGSCVSLFLVGKGRFPGDSVPVILRHSHSLGQMSTSVARCLARCNLTEWGTTPQIDLTSVPPTSYVSFRFCLMLKCMFLEVFLCQSFLPSCEWILLGWHVISRAHWKPNKMEDTLMKEYKQWPGMGRCSYWTGNFSYTPVLIMT